MPCNLPMALVTLAKDFPTSMRSPQVRSHLRASAEHQGAEIAKDEFRQADCCLARLSGLLHPSAALWIYHLTCFSVFTLSWMGRGSPIRVSVSLWGMKEGKYEAGKKIWV